MAAKSEPTAASVKVSLVNFIKSCTGSNIESAIDDILVTYLLAMVDPDTLEDDFDVDALRETLSAYIPETDQITDGQLSQWVHDIAGLLPHQQTGVPAATIESSFVNFRTSSGKAKKEIVLKEEPEIKAKGKIDDTRVDEVALDALCEMFPHKNSLRVRKCLLIANGDVDNACQLLLQDDELENDELVLSSTEMTAPKAQVDEKTLREQIINRYAYLDVDEDKIEHKPVVPKSEPKKLIRYRDNKVVSVKGERFTIEKKTQEVEN